MSLAAVSTADLAKLRDLVASGALRCPLTETGLQAHGLGAAASSLCAALPFDSSAMMARALELVVDERRRAERRPIELVWTGPGISAPQTRDTPVVLGELFRAAEHRVLLAGYRFSSQRGSIFAPLHEALRRGVTARLFLHIDPTQSPTDEYVAGRIREFVRFNWPFGSPYPAFFYDPRTLRGNPDTILHAKCAVADGRRALVTSANFTTPGQERHLEVGALIEDEHFASRLERQFNGLVSEGHLLEIPASAVP